MPQSLLAAALSLLYSSLLLLLFEPCSHCSSFVHHHPTPYHNHNQNHHIHTTNPSLYLYPIKHHYSISNPLLLYASQRSPPSSSSSNFQTRSESWIVVVDDEEPIRLAIGEYLYNAGYSVSACADAQAVLELLDSVRLAGIDDNDDDNDDNDNDEDGKNGVGEGMNKLPDAIISDIRMPATGMSGIDLLKRLRLPPPSPSPPSPPTSPSPFPTPPDTNRFYDNNHNRAQLQLRRLSLRNELYREIPFIILSAKAMTKDRIEGYRLGADAYMTKPFDPEELCAVLDRVVGRMRRMRVEGFGLGGGRGGEGGGLEEGEVEVLRGEIRGIKEILERRVKRRGGGGGLISSSSSSSSSTAATTTVTKERQRPESTANKSNNQYKTLPTTSSSSSSKTKSPPKSPISTSTPALTPTEQTTLELLSRGYTNGEIAKARKSGSATSVGKVVSRLYQKTGTKTRTELLRYAIRMGYVDAPRSV